MFSRALLNFVTLLSFVLLENANDLMALIRK